MTGRGGMPIRKMETLRAAAIAKTPVEESAQVAMWKGLAAMWIKRALDAETKLAIYVEGIVK